MEREGKGREGKGVGNETYQLRISMHGGGREGGWRGGGDVDVSTKGMGWHVGPTTWL